MWSTGYVSKKHCFRITFPPELHTGCGNIHKMPEIKCFKPTLHKYLTYLFGLNAMSLDSKNNPH
jgi:hypothetical protein